MIPDIAQLLDEISRMNNLYGFCARHFISGEQEPNKFVEEVYQAIMENRIIADDKLKVQIEKYIGDKNKI